jgi:hypothetical protein
MTPGWLPRPVLAAASADSCGCLGRFLRLPRPVHAAASAGVFFSLDVVVVGILSSVVVVVVGGVDLLVVLVWFIVVVVVVGVHFYLVLMLLLPTFAFSCELLSDSGSPIPPLLSHTFCLQDRWRGFRNSHLGQ